MKKRLVIVLASLIGLFTVGYLLMLFMFYYEPTPDKSDVEAMVNERDLQEFGEVEGSYLLTPRNYGYYNDHSIYIVEQYLDKGKEYGDQYVVIERGSELTEEDEPAIEKIQAREVFQSDHRYDLQVISKHRMTVYKNGDKVEEDWLFKITCQYDGSYYLTFILPEKIEESRFNFSTEGYDQFLQF
ncbi:hypothetical protein [Metaplanococcus flavidus]|uniref:Uncharacterized protein n=1 Tax=Metaplanococcus flavidus TaxID=569883 RepID=A0ABW3L6N2_9BACL